MQLASMATSCPCSIYSLSTQRAKIWGKYEPVGEGQKEEVKLLKFMAPPLMAAVITLSPICYPPDHEGQKEEVKLLKFMAPPLMAAVITLSPICYPPVSVGQTTIDAQKGAALFRRACIGCHDTGGNIIQPGATLFLNDLQRNGVDTEEEIYRVTYYGKGRMPGFGEKCTPRGQCTFGARLQEDEIRVLAEFVKSQADQGWPKIETQGDD